MVHKLNWRMRTGLNALRARYITVCTGPSLKENFMNRICLKNENKLLQHQLIETPFNVQFYQSKSCYSTCNKDHTEKKKNFTDKHIVYFGQHGSFIKGLKVFSLSTSLITILAQPYMYSTLSSLSGPAMILSYSMMGFYIFASPLFIHLITKKYVTEITYDSLNDSYILNTLTFFLQNKKVHFRIEDVQENKSPSMFVSFLIKGEPKIIFEEGFFDKNHFIKMMGYDKPLKLKQILQKNSVNEDVESKSQK